MSETIKDVALDYIDSERECNFYAANRKLTLYVYNNQAVDVESIWKGEDNGKVYLHCGCKEFEADIDIESLSDENQQRVREVLMCVSLSPKEVRNLTEQWKDEPLVFLFRVADVDREEIDRGMSREECFKRCANYYLLSELGDSWNDTDDDMQCMLDIKSTWCYVSRPEKKADEQAKKRDRLMKETIVMLAADIYQTIYDRDDCDGWGQACDDVIRYAEQFEKELCWQEDDDRDYIVELEKFEKKVLDEIKKEG